MRLGDFAKRGFHVQSLQYYVTNLPSQEGKRCYYHSGIIMPSFKTYAIRGVLAYIAFLIIYFVFSAASMSNASLAFYERKLNPSTYVFAQFGKFYATPPIFLSPISDWGGQLSDDQPAELADYDMFVVLLNGEDDAEGKDVATQLGLDDDDIAAVESGSKVTSSKVGLNLRLHIVPVYMARTKILALNAEIL